MLDFKSRQALSFFPPWMPSVRALPRILKPSLRRMLREESCLARDSALPPAPGAMRSCGPPCAACDLQLPPSAGQVLVKEGFGWATSID